VPKSDDQKRRELGENYAAMSDEEISLLAKDVGSLTPMAKDLLKAEFLRRKLNVDLEESEDETAAADEGLIILRKFRDLAEAELVQELLASQGIESFLLDATTVRMDWFLSYALGAIKLCVRKKDAEAAAAALAQSPPEGIARPESFEVEGVGTYEQPRCPKCGSMEVSFKGLDKRLSYATLFVSFPIPVEYPGWKCFACGHEWDDGAEDNPA
jgi:hypothetical protein